MSGAVNPNLHTVHLCDSAILQNFHFFIRCHDNNSVIMMSVSKFCVISWRSWFKSLLRPWVKSIYSTFCNYTNKGIKYWCLTDTPANIYLPNINYKSSLKKREICSKLTIKTPEWRHNLLLFIVFLVLTLKR